MIELKNVKRKADSDDDDLNLDDEETGLDEEKLDDAENEGLEKESEEELE